MKPPLKAAHKTPLASLSRLVVLLVLPAAKRLARAASLNFVSRSKPLRAFPPRGDYALAAGRPLLGVPGRGSAHHKGSIEWADMGFLE